MITHDEILKVLEGLEGFEIKYLEDAWYSNHTIERLQAEMGQKVEISPPTGCVRAATPGNGMLELHIEGDQVKVLCYCCFGGNPEKGKYPLDQLRAAIEGMANHYCPPWPG